MLSEEGCSLHARRGKLRRMPAQNDTFMNSATQHSTSASGT